MNLFECPRPISVRVLEAYTLLVTFANGTQKTYDMEPELKLPIYEKLKDTDFFLQAHIKYNTVVWDEDVDVSPYALYEFGEDYVEEKEKEYV